jgi:hypothetical protein
MRRSLWTRTVSALFAVWLALVMGEAGFAHHHCPMHDGPMPPAAGVATGGQHGAHGSHDTPNGGEHHACTCLGACCVSNGAITLAAGPEIPAVAVGLPSATIPGAASIATPAARALFTLPFANGPPTAIA